MESILANLHLDITALTWHSVNFLVLLGILWFLFFRPFGRVMAQRQQRIHESLARADEIARLDAVAQAEREALIAEAHSEAAEIRRRAHDQVQRFVVRSRARANADADRIREQAAERHAPPGTPPPSRPAGELSIQRHGPRVVAARGGRAQPRQELGSRHLEGGKQSV
jgi:preprotein translocase subunit YajC